MRDQRQQLRAFGHLVAGCVKQLGHHAIGRRGNRVLHLHGIEHRQRLAARHGVAGLDGKGHDLAGHGRGQAAAVVMRLTGMRERIDQRDVRGAGGAEHMKFFTRAIYRHTRTLAGERQVHLTMTLRKRQLTGLACKHKHQAAIVHVSQAGAAGCTGKLKIEIAFGDAVRLPAIAAAEGVGRLQRLFIEEGLRNGCCGCQRQPQRIAIEQHRALAFDQSGVKPGVGK